MSSRNPSTALIFAIVATMLAFTPSLFEHFRNMWARPEYQYFPFAIAAAGWLLWNRGKKATGLFAISNTQRSRVVALLVVTWLLLAAAIFFRAPLLAAAGAVLGLACVFKVFFADRQVTNKWGIWALLWLLVPLPLGMDRGLATWLQTVSSRLSSALLDLIGINHAMAANVLQLPSRDLFVDEACSGVVSVMSVITCGAIWAVWKNRSLLHSVLLIVSGVIWALSLNVARICIIAAGEAWYAVDLSSGTAHDVLGLVLFLGTFIALVSTDQLLLFLLAPIKFDEFWRQYGGVNWLADDWNRLVTSWTPQPVLNEAVSFGDVRSDDEVAAGHQQSTDLTTSDRPSTEPFSHGRAAIGVGLGFAMLVVWQLPFLFAGSNWSESIAFANSFHEESLPENIGQWKRIKFEEAQRDRFRGFADHSKVFAYQFEEEGPIATFSLDYPFTGRWHDLDNCYTSSGWTQLQLMNKSGAPDNDWQFVESEFDRTDGTRGYLLYSFFDGEGAKMQPPTTATIIGPILERMMESSAASSSRRLFQVQVFLTGNASQATKSAAEQLFIQGREALRTKMEQAARGNE
jgi:exosortase